MRAHFGTIISNRDLAVETQANPRELAGDICEMRVDSETEHQLATGIDEFGPHAGEPSQAVGQSQMTRRFSPVGQQFLGQVDRAVLRIADGAADFVFEELAN